MGPIQNETLDTTENAPSKPFRGILDDREEIEKELTRIRFELADLYEQVSQGLPPLLRSRLEARINNEEMNYRFLERRIAELNAAEDRRAAELRDESAIRLQKSVSQATWVAANAALLSAVIAACSLLGVGEFLKSLLGGE